MRRLDTSPTTPAEERAAWEALLAERDAEIARLRDVDADWTAAMTGAIHADPECECETLSGRVEMMAAEIARLRARVAAYDSVRDVLVERLRFAGSREMFDRLTAALAATEGK